MKSKLNLIILISLFIISIITFHRLLRPGYFSMMDDMHVFRLQQFDQCLKDGQIPCRFIKDGGLGYGYPLFNYYSPLAYGLAEIFHTLGFSLINSLKITFGFIHIIGVYGMFFFTKLLWGNLGAFVSAIIFLLAPYQATDSFVRGAIAESLAINIIPWIFYFLTRYINSNKNKFLLIISITSLFLSHNLTSLAIAPTLIIYSIFLLLKNKNINLRSIIKIVTPVFISLGLSSFFIVPAIFEKKLVTVDTMTQGYFQYIIHFATLKQLFISRFWGYGASLWGPIDDMAFSIGLVQWLIPLISIIFLFFKKSKKNYFISLLFFIFFIFSVFLTHNKSTFIWKAFPFMSYFQFPWRFLSIAVFAASVSAGSVIFLINKKLQVMSVIIIAITTILLNFSYFKEDIWYPNLTDNQKLSATEIVKQSGAGLKDYWPKYSQSYPSSFAPSQPQTSPNTNISSYTKTSNQLKFKVSTPNDSQITVPLVYFPDWQLFIDNQKTVIQTEPNLGLIKFTVPSGNHSINLKLKNTPIRTISNIISLISIILIITCISIKTKKSHEK